MSDTITLPDVINRADVETTKGESDQRLDLARSLVVTDIISCQFAERVGNECARVAKEIDTRFEPAKKKTHEAWKAVTDLIASLKKPIKEAQDIADRKAREWRQAEQKRIAIENEKRRKEEQEKRDAEKLALAEKAENAGLGTVADRILDEPDALPELEPLELEKTEGVSYRENWQGEVVDESLIPREYLVPDLKKLAAVTKALKANTKIPGWRVFDRGTTVHK